jgi:hypothetical protein
MSNSTYKIEIKGLKELSKAFKKAPEIAAPIYARAINRQLVFIRQFTTDDIFQFKTPRGLRTGLLAKSFGLGIDLATPKKLTGSIGPTVKYAKWVNDGTDPYVIKTRSKQVLANSKTGEFFGKIVRHPGTSANPFMERIKDKASGPTNKAFLQALEEINKQIADSTK